MASAGQALRRQLVGSKTIDDTTFGTWGQLRKNLGELLQLDADNLGQLKTAVSILAPSVGSIVGVSAGK